MEALQQEPAAMPLGPEWPDEKTEVLMLVRMRDQIKQQLMEHSTAVRAGQENDIEHIAEEEVFKSTIQDLEEDIEELKVSFQNKTLALQRIQLTVALRNKVNQNDDDSRLIMETMKQIVTVSQAIIEHQQQLRENEQKLIDIKSKRLLLKKTEGHKLLQTYTMMKKQKEGETKKATEKLEKIRKKLQKEREITIVIQNVFQVQNQCIFSENVCDSSDTESHSYDPLDEFPHLMNIIIGSRVNWAEDPSLKAIVLQLEKNVLYE